MRQIIQSSAYAKFALSFVLAFALPLSACGQSGNEQQDSTVRPSVAEKAIPEPVAKVKKPAVQEKSGPVIAPEEKILSKPVVRSEKIKAEQPRSEQFRSEQFRSEQFRSEQFRSEQTKAVKKEPVKVAVARVDVKVLTERLKKTDAIGFFTKLAIRNDLVDLTDTINRYRKKSILKDKMKEIRASFDGLLLKIVALLDEDPALSRDLYVGRESIWKSLLEVNA